MKKKAQQNLINYQKLFVFAIILFTLFILFSFVFYHYLPDVKNIKKDSKSKIVYLLDRNQDIFQTYGKEKVNYITYDKFPPYLIDAVISIEDRRFFKHFGIDLFSIPRAFWTNIVKQRYAQGASTITQQLAKMLFLDSKKTLTRKFKEIYLAIKLERHYTKSEIMEMYLNKAYFGSGNYGVVAASRDYFNKDVDKLTLNEAALLAGLLKAPSKYSPKINPELSRERTDLVLDSMFKNKSIDESELIIAEYQDNAWNKNFSVTDNYKYFIDWLKEDLRGYQEFFPFDLRVKTTFDQDIHRIADRVITDFFQTYDAYKDTQLALVAMSMDGAVLSMIGGKNYKRSQFNRSIFGQRQAGSAFKLFVYLEALKAGMINDDKLIDEPVDIKGWKPQNYKDKYYGEMTLREAFVRSINSIAAQIAVQVGIKNIIKLAEKMGINSEIPKLPSIALGTGEVNLLEMVTAYTVVANGGYKVVPYGILEVKDNYGNILFEQVDQEHPKILAQDIVDNMDNLLNGVVVWGTGRQANIPGMKIRGKTGTSQNYRDAWFIGYNDDLVIGIWLGSDKEKSDLEITGGGAPARIFRDIMYGIYY